MSAIAIIGLGCRFPGGVRDAATLGDVLELDHDVLGEVPPSRWDAHALHDADPAAPGGIYARRGGFLEDHSHMDAGFFGISALEAERLDPQQRLLLEVGWEALEDGGLDPRALEGSRTGVYVGISHSDYWEQLAAAGDTEGTSGYALAGNELALASGRLAYQWGFAGPAVSIATACSSSLVAVHQAMRALRSGEVDRALAGGVNAILQPSVTQYLCRLGALSADGRCKVFDASADGYVRSEGCGLIVLERLDDALANRRRILAVLRGSAVNQDGRTNGLTAPNGHAQEAVIRAALADAGVVPADVDFIETHATGSTLGDPIELHAIGAALGDRPEPVRVSSVKSRLGHAESAAGISGLLAAVAALRRGQVPRTLHLSTPNPLVRWQELPVRALPEPWSLPDRGRPRIAGVSSFGLSGTNAHVVVEEAPVAGLARANRGPWLIPLAAHSEAALRERAATLADHVARRGVAVADVAASLGRRAVLGVRAGVVAADREGLLEALRGVATRTAAEARTEGSGKIGFLFTGPGTTYPGMGRGLYEAFPAYRDALEEADLALSPHVDEAVLDLVLHEADAARLAEPARAQLVLFALEYALSRLWASWGVRPDAVIGESLGEIVAACVAGVLSLDDAAELVAARGRALSALPHGLPVPDMAPGVPAVRAVAERLRHAPARIPWVTTVTGGVVRGVEAEHWARHAVAPVRFLEGARTLEALGVRTWIEIGPHPVLVEMAQQGVAPAGARWIASLRRGMEDARTALAALGMVFESGRQIDAPGRGQLVDLPPYPFQRQRHWIEPVRTPRRAPAPAAARGAWAQELAPLPPARRLGVVLDAVRAEVARVLGLAGRDAIAAGRALKELGLDSVKAIELRNALGYRVGATLPATLAYDHPTPAAMATYLLDKVLAAAERPTVVAAEPARVPGPADEPIAIVGIGCRYPGGVCDAASFWRLLDGGVDAVGEVPAERWDLDALYDPDPEARGKMITRSGGFLRDIDQFDPGFFDISPREATSLDPQQRLLLETSWEALEHAGIAPDRLTGSRTGVFVGLMYQEYAALGGSSLERLDGYVGTGSTASVASGRISYVLGLQGPSMTVDTACSSSLVTVHLACQALRQGECSAALAGGVALMLTPGVFVEFSRLRGLALDGRCKSFSDEADGTGWAEGCGMLVLERLSDAQRNGHRVLAVIRGSAVNQDGRSNGLTAPNGPAQEAVIRQALRQAGVAPAQIQYVECHGTGTSLGDPIEVQALGSVLAEGRDPAQPVVIGSVKSNLGHAQAAAGAAGVIKVVLALEHGRIPKNLHFTTPSSHIPWSELPVKVASEPIAWRPSGVPRLAGVSSFGISGTNAHVVLEEAPATESIEVSPPEERLHCLPLSAKHPEALRELAARYAEHLERHPEQPLADICHTAGVGRAHFEERLAVVASSREDLHAQLQRAACVPTGTEGVRVRTTGQPRVAFLCTGQGAQYAEMGRRLYATQPVFRDALDRCASLLTAHLEHPLLAVLHSETESARLDQTASTQPGLFALEYALAELWRSWGIVPDAVMGHSVGEYVAACIAGTMSLEDALMLVAERGRRIQALPAGGAMASVQAAAPCVAEVLGAYRDHVSIAAINAPDQVVISGDGAALDAVCSALEARGIKTKRLIVSHAFHSPRMDPMLDDFERLVSSVELHAPVMPIVSNVTGALAGDELATAAYWRRHVRAPVEFANGIRALHDRGITLFVELGPQPILSGLGAQCLPDAGVAWLPSLRKGLPDDEVMLASLAELYARGVAVDWAAVQGPGRRVGLPTYPWQRQRYWLDAREGEPARGGHRRPATGHPLIGESQGISTHAALRVWQAALDPKHLPWLRDQCARRTVDLPGEVYLEMALACGAQVFRGEPFEVIGLAVERALPLAGDAALTVQVVTNEEPSGHQRFQVASQAPDAGGGASWAVHARGTLHGRDRDRTEAAVAPSALQARLVAVPLATAHAALTGRGLDHGAALRAITGVWQGEGEVLGRLIAGHSPAAYELPPAVLEASLCVVNLALSDDEATPWLLAAIDAIQLGPLAPSAELWCHVQVIAGGGEGPDQRRVDLRLRDASGALVAVLSGLTMRRGERWTEQADWLTSVPPDAREAAIAELLRTWIARVLRIPADRVTPAAPFATLGMDSLMGMELRNRVQSVLELPLPATLFMTNGNVEALARILLHTWLELRGNPRRRRPPIRRAARDGALALSYAQEQIWFLYELEPASSAYNVALQVRMRGRLDHAALARSFEALVARHESLRTTFRSAAGVPEAVIAPVTGGDRKLELPITGVATEADARTWARREAETPFDLTAGPLLRARLLRLAGDDHVLVLAMHHIVTDAWSLGVLLRELVTLYGAFQLGLPSPLPELAVQYADYAAWQRQVLGARVMEELVAFWTADLAGAPVLELTTDRPRPPVQSFRGARLRFELGRERAQAVRRLCEREGVTLFIPLLAAFATLLHRYSGQDDFVIGTLTANRTQLEIEDVIGFFVNALPLRLDLGGDPDVHELCARMQRRMLAATTHQDLPFDQIVQAAERRRDASRNPLFQVQLVLQAAVRELELPGLASEVSEIDTDTAKRDLTLTIFDGETLSGHVEYATDLFDAVRIERLVEHFQVLVDAMTRDPAQRLSALPLLTASEQALYVARAVRPAADARSIQELFEAAVARAPAAMAVASSGGALTYRQLDEAANRLARSLRKRGVGPNVAVALRAGRSPDMLIGLLGILKAGGIYVPIDPAYPEDRIAHMLADARVAIELADVAGPDIAAESPAPVASLTTPDHVAYVIYTSGSTGKPKGVMVTHGSVVEYAETLGRELAIGASDVYLHTASISFSSSIRQALVPLCAGATVVIADHDERRDPIALVRRIRDARVTVVDLVPTVVRHVVDAVAALGLDQRAELLDNRVRLLVTASEVLRFELVDEFRAQVGARPQWINMYGQTETTGIVSLYPVPMPAAHGGKRRGIVPIGRPRGNVAMYVLDRQLRPLPCGIAGDLYIGGKALAEGYAGEPSWTAERFVPDPWTRGERLYATGDVVQLGWDGTIEFLGRSDHQVKVRGLRVEPAEIENVLLQHAGVREAVIATYGDGHGGHHLVAYVTANRGQVPAKQLRAHVGSKLPEYMIPWAFVALERLPLTPNGKLDRAALPEPERARASEVEYVAPQGHAEEVLAGIWRQVLHLDRVGARDNFFALGGHSLLGARVKAQIRSALGIELPLSAIFEEPTLAALAARIAASSPAGGSQTRPPLVRAARTERLPASYAQDLMWHAEQAEPGSRAHWIDVALRLRGSLDAPRLVQSVQEVLGRHEVLRTVFRRSNGTLSQVILPPGTPDVPILDAPSGAAGAASRPIDLAESPAIRSELVRHAEDDHVLELSMHRIAGDGLSMRLLLREISAHYAGSQGRGRAPLPVAGLQYADYAAWERGWLTGETLEKQLAFWRRALHGATAAFTIPTDHPRPSSRLRRGGRHRFEFARDHSAAVHVIAAHEQASLPTVLLAAFASAIGRYTGQPDVVIGSAVSRRSPEGTEQIIGPFMNTVPLRIRVGHRSSVRELLPHVKAAALAALDYQDAPFQLVVDEAAAEHGAAASGLGQVAFVMAEADEAEPGGVPLGELSPTLEAPVHLTSRRDLTLAISVANGAIAGTITYDHDLFDAATIARIAGDCEAALATAGRDGGRARRSRDLSSRSL